MEHIMSIDMSVIQSLRSFLPSGNFQQSSLIYLSAATLKWLYLVNKSAKITTNQYTN